MEKIRVLVVDDSLVVRRVVTEVLDAQEDMEVAGSASNGQVALTKMSQLKPDLVVLDIEMPEMDGLTALTHLRKDHPRTPVIMFSSLTELGAKATLEALSRGASDFFAKPGGAGGLEASRKLIQAELVPAIRALCPRKKSKPTKHEPAVAPPKPAFQAAAARVDAIAIGASTGGPNALAEVFSALPASLPAPIFVVQHMPPMFTHLLAERLAKGSHVPTVEANSGTVVEPGKAWVAPGNYHFVVARDGTRVVTRVQQDPPENACRPAADPLFRSVAAVYGRHCLAVVLTGMGQDGLRGCEAIRAAGGQILAQDEASSVVWGMPGFVVRAGLADKVLPLSMIAAEIARRVKVGRE
jgi:two-component system chemotaxis response regulator CheB